MWIAEAAEAAGVNVQTIRYYERRGLLPKPGRRASGYREFSPEAVRLSYDAIYQRLRASRISAG